jgi:glycosyltransferase involved in cell wall biosynthesis
VNNGVESRILTRNKVSADPRVTGPEGKLSKFLVPLRFHLGLAAAGLQKSANLNFHSINRLPSRWAPGLSSGSDDLVHLHFVAGETMSIEDIGHIRKPLVWTLHDMWAFSGAEHYGDEGSQARWRAGYTRSNRPVSDSGLDWDRSTWQRKKRAWRRPFPLVTPSRWLAQCARESALFRDWPVSVIPNLLDTQAFQPLDKGFCRQALGLPKDKTIVLFGALGGAQDPRKGYPLLVEALRLWGKSVEPDQVLGIVFGQGEPAAPPELPYRLTWVGHLSDDVALTLLYNAADVMVVPSRQEAFGQTASEALACGTPVVAFAATGLLDIVEDRVTGYLARPFDAADLAAGLTWVLAVPERLRRLSEAARHRAVSLWSPQTVVAQHRELYQKTIEAFLR